MSRATTASAFGAMVLGLAAAVTTPVQAQQQIAIGQAISGSLTVSDLQWSDGARYDPCIFYGQAGQFVTITMTSSDFDSYLILQDMNGNQIGYNGRRRRAQRADLAGTADDRDLPDHRQGVSSPWPSSCA